MFLRKPDGLIVKLYRLCIFTDNTTTLGFHQVKLMEKIHRGMISPFFHFLLICSYFFQNLFLPRLLDIRKNCQLCEGIVKIEDRYMGPALHTVDVCF